MPFLISFGSASTYPPSNKEIRSNRCCKYSLWKSKICDATCKACVRRCRRCMSPHPFPSKVRSITLAEHSDSSSFSHYNQQARLENSQLFRLPNEPLTPLRSARTNEAIQDFPVNAAAIDHLGNPELTDMLVQLDVPLPPGGQGSVSRRRAALKKAVGIYGQFTAVP